MYYKIKTILYHGTASEISHVNVGLGRGRKDFGKVGSLDAKRILLNNLETENLGIRRK